MFDPKKLEQIAKQIHDSMPQPVKELGSDVDQSSPSYPRPTKQARRC